MNLSNLAPKFDILSELIFFSITLAFIKNTSFINKYTDLKVQRYSKKIDKGHLSRMVLKGAKILGIKKCLIISLVMHRAFKKHGHNSKIIIGWRLTDKFYSHSWIESDHEYYPPIEKQNSKKFKKIKVF